MLGTEEPLLPSRKSTNKKEDTTKNNIVAAIDPTFQTKIVEPTTTAAEFDKDRLAKPKGGVFLLFLFCLSITNNQILINK